MKRMIIIPYDKYNRLQKQDSVSQSEERVVEEVSTNDNIKGDIDSILYTFPKKYRNKAEQILQYILKNTPITWDIKGEISVDGKSIRFSNITDLIKDSLFPYKHFQPIGFEEFYSHLDQIPLTLVQNPTRRKLIQEGRGSSGRPRGPPPPGLPPDDIKPVSLYSKHKHPPSRQKPAKARGSWKQMWSALP